MDTSKYHLNTHYIKHNSQLSQGPYESLRNQISRQNRYNPRYVQKSQNTMQQAMNQLNKFINGSQQLDYQKLSSINSIKLTPIFNQNFISSFDQNQYHLQSTDKVKIVKQKVFRVQNYYNYLYQLKCNEQHKQMTKNLQQKLKQARSKMQKDKNQPQSQQKLKSLKFQSNSKNQQNHLQNKQMELAPLYTKYEQTRKSNQRYFMKQKDRQMIASKYDRQQKINF